MNTYPRINLDDPPFVSIIIPTFNEEKYIEQTLAHARNQNYAGKYEVILSDCNSTDSTREIAKKYADRILSCPKRSTGGARNHGANNAKGEYFLFVDADTWIPPDYLTKVYAALKEDPGLVALSAAFQFTPRTPFFLLLQLYINTRFWVKDRFFHQAPVLGYNFFIRKDAFFKNGQFKECFFEDLYFYKKLNLTNQRTKYLQTSKVTISARRIQKYGFLKTYIYYNTRRVQTEQFLFDSWYQPTT
jgi:glycosyltransferase involved in cell wall biosynthesis